MSDRKIWGDGVVEWIMEITYVNYPSVTFKLASDSPPASVSLSSERHWGVPLAGALGKSPTTPFPPLPPSASVAEAGGCCCQKQWCSDPFGGGARDAAKAVLWRAEAA